MLAESLPVKAKPLRGPFTSFDTAVTAEGSLHEEDEDAAGHRMVLLRIC
jgi:hypothetical protein